MMIGQILDHFNCKVQNKTEIKYKITNQSQSELRNQIQSLKSDTRSEIQNSHKLKYKVRNQKFS